MAAIIEVNGDDFEKALKAIELQYRTVAIGKAARAAGNVVKKKAKQLVPVGDPQHKPGIKPLKDSITVKVKSYGDGIRQVAIVGARRPQGNHDHLIEYGHWIRRRGKKGEGPGQWYGARVEGKEYMAPAADTTRNEQRQAIVEALQKIVRQHKKNG